MIFIPPPNLADSVDCQLREYFLGTMDVGMTEIDYWTMMDILNTQSRGDNQGYYYWYFPGAKHRISTLTEE